MTDMKEERFSIEGIPVTYYRGGQGAPLLLIHGSGPGASSMGYWRISLPAFTRHFEVFAMDLIGFGKSGRKPEPPYFEFGLWMRQTQAMLDRIDQPRVGIIGHSIAASLALQAAAVDSRVQGVITTGAMGAPFEPNDGTRRVWTCPADRDALARTLRTVVYDQSLVDDDYIAAREPVLFAPGYADYFNSMFAGDARQYVQASVIPDATLAAIECPVLMIHGRDDVPFPPEVSQALAPKIARADLLLLSRCSHSVAVEYPAKLAGLAGLFFDPLLLSNA